jgi:DNA polymerase-3 subunit delta
MLYPESQLTVSDIRHALSNFSHYRSDQLSDAFLQKNFTRYWKILEVLKQESEPLPLLLWRLSEDSRTLYKLVQLLERGQSVDSACKATKLFYERKAQFQRYISSANTRQLAMLIKEFGLIDRQIKGLISGSAWERLRRLPFSVSV